MAGRSSSPPPPGTPRPTRSKTAGWRLSLGTFTVLPTGVIDVVDPRVARQAMLVAPLAFLPLGLVAGLVAWVATLASAPSLLTGLLVVGTVALGTRAIHLDGLADTVDGLGSGWDREKALDVMRRGDVGPMGVVALIVMLALQAQAYGTLAAQTAGPLRVTLVLCGARAAVTLACLHGIPAARAGGLGAAVAGSVSRLAAALLWVGVAAVLTVVTAVAVDDGPTALVATGAAVGCVLLLLRRCVTRFGGVTGDVMGACVEVAATVLAVVGVLRWPST